MFTLHAFTKAAPEGFQPCCRPGQGTYKYFVRGKGCTLGVLFETSAHVCFEWLTEDDMLVDYPPEIRYKAWPKREFKRLLAMGVWDVTGEGPRTHEADLLLN